MKVKDLILQLQQLNQDNDVRIHFSHEDADLEDRPLQLVSVSPDLGEPGPGYVVLCSMEQPNPATEVQDQVTREANRPGFSLDLSDVEDEIHKARLAWVEAGGNLGED